MKKVILIAGFATLLLGACTSVKLATTNDDVYASPADDKRERERIALEKKKAQEAEDRERAEEVAAQKAKDDANPVYKSPSYNKDDYYDYEYAARLKRFNNNSYSGGMGYYDNWYTNSYWYNNNPSMYGVSIYSSYNYWGSSNYGYGGYHPYNNYGYNSYGNGYMNGYNQGYMNGMYGYNPYGSYGYNPYGGYGYNPYGGYGYNPYGGYGYNPYGGYGYNPYNSYGGGWGYFNQYDVNSNYSKPTYAPRGSHDGGNGLRMSNPGRSEESYAAKYIQSVNAAQETAPKFVGRNVGSTKNGGNINYSSNDNSNYNPGRPANGNSNSDNSYNNNSNSDHGNFNSYNPKGNLNSNGNATMNSNNSDPKPTFGNNAQPVEMTPHHQYNQQGNNYNSQPVESAPKNNPPKSIFESGNSPTFNNSPGKHVESNPQPSYSPSRGSGGNGGGGGGGTIRPR